MQVNGCVRKLKLTGVGSQGAGCSRGLRCRHTIQVPSRGNPVTCSGEDSGLLPLRSPGPAPAHGLPGRAPFLSESGSRRGGWQAGFPRRRDAPPRWLWLLSHRLQQGAAEAADDPGGGTHPQVGALPAPLPRHQRGAESTRTPRPGRRGREGGATGGRAGQETEGPSRLSRAAASRGRRAASTPRAAVGTGLFLKNACFEVFYPCTLVFTIEKLENIESHQEKKIAKAKFSSPNITADDILVCQLSAFVCVWAVKHHHIVSPTSWPFPSMWRCPWSDSYSTPLSMRGR